MKCLNISVTLSIVCGCHLLTVMSFFKVLLSSYISLCLYIFLLYSLSVSTVIFPGGAALVGIRMSPFWILLELRVMEIVVTSELVRHAKLQSKCRLQQTNTLFIVLLVVYDMYLLPFGVIVVSVLTAIFQVNLG